MDIDLKLDRILDKLGEHSEVLAIASALTSAAQLGGTFVQEGGSAGVAYCPGNIQGSVANDKATFIYSPTHTATRILTYTYTYLVLS